MVSQLLCAFIINLVLLSTCGLSEDVSETTVSSDEPVVDSQDDFSRDNRTKGISKSIKLPPSFKVAESSFVANRDNGYKDEGYNLGNHLYSGGQSALASYTSNSYAGSRLWGPNYEAPTSYQAPQYSYEAPKKTYESYEQKPNYDSSFYNQPSYQATYSSNYGGWGNGGGDQSVVMALALKYAQLKKKYERDLAAASSDQGIPYGLILAGLPLLLLFASSGFG